MAPTKRPLHRPHANFMKSLILLRDQKPLDRHNPAKSRLESEPQYGDLDAQFFGHPPNRGCSYVPFSALVTFCGPLWRAVLSGAASKLDVGLQVFWCRAC